MFGFTMNDQTPAFRAAQLAAILARHYPAANPYHVAKVVSAMQSATRQAKAWEIRRCNDPMTEKQEERGYTRKQKLQEKVNGMLRELGDVPEHACIRLGGDPRGSCGQLIVHGLRGDGIDVEDGFAIY